MPMGLDLGKQVGPLPLGAWVVVVGGGLGIAWWTRRNSVLDAPAENPPADENPGVGVGGAGQWTQLIPVAPATGLEPEIKTNEEWGQRAIRWLISMGFPPATSDSAIRKYLVAEQPTLQEQMLISLALGHFGPPPNALPPTPVTEPPPPVTQPPTLPNNPVPTAPTASPRRTFTVTKWPAPGSSLWSIASIMYGNPMRWNDIYNANRNKISNPNVIQPGWVLVIP